MLDGHRGQHRFAERTATILFRILAPLLPRAMRVSSAAAVAAAALEGAIAAPRGTHVKTNEAMP